MGSLTPSIKKALHELPFPAAVAGSVLSRVAGRVPRLHHHRQQLPGTDSIDLFGFHSTWGAFSFPFIFLATDLTVRLIGKAEARRVILRAMIPALIASYIVSV